MSEIIYHFKPYALVLIGFGCIVAHPNTVVTVAGAVCLLLGLGIMRMRGVF